MSSGQTEKENDHKKQYTKIKAIYLDKFITNTAIGAKIERCYIDGVYPRTITAFLIEDAVGWSKQLFASFERQTFKQVKFQF